MKIPENLWLQDIKKTEYIFLAVKSIAVILLITYVFYESFLPIFFMIPIWVIYARDGLRDLCRKKEKEFRVQFSNAIQAMGAALKAGYSVENAIREAEKDLAPMYEENVRIRKEFRKMVHQLDMKMPAVSVMEQFSERMKQEDTEDFVTVFSSAKMSGGDSISIIRNAVENPERPFVAILGGAKVSSKISVINNLLDKVDTLIIGGGMSYTFTKAQGGSVGASLLEEDYLQYALDMIKKAEEKGVKLLLPVDTIVADEFSNDANTKVVSRDAIPDGWMGLDIGPETAKIFAEAVKSAKTVVWNGPMGCFEMPKFAEGTKVVAEALANTEAVTIIGGGDSAAAVNQLGFGDKMTHISTGGGASLEFLEGKELPGVAAANDK